MRIVCKNSDCLYFKNSECTLTRASSPGNVKSECVYHTIKEDKI